MTTNDERPIPKRLRKRLQAAMRALNDMIEYGSCDHHVFDPVDPEDLYNIGQMLVYIGRERQPPEPAPPQSEPLTDDDLPF